MRDGTFKQPVRNNRKTIQVNLQGQAQLTSLFPGALQDAGERTKPFSVELTGRSGLFFGVRYVGGVLLGTGVGSGCVATVASNLRQYSL